MFIRLIDLPCRVKGYTSVDEEGNYNVLINRKMSLETQQKACIHELRHITGCDFECCNADEVEFKRIYGG